MAPTDVTRAALGRAAAAPRRRIRRRSCPASAGYALRHQPARSPSEVSSHRAGHPHSAHDSTREAVRYHRSGGSVDHPSRPGPVSPSGRGCPLHWSIDRGRCGRPHRKSRCRSAGIGRGDDGRRRASRLSPSDRFDPYSRVDRWISRTELVVDPAADRQRINNENARRLRRIALMMCRICFNEKENEPYRLREMMFGSRDEFDYLECSRCKCLQIASIPASMSKYYPAGYYSFPAGAPRSWILRFLLKERNRYALTGRGIIGKLLHRYAPPKLPLSSLAPLGLGHDARILDVGCGRGLLF